METRTIEHPLRTITLAYDEAKTETPNEKELLQSYISLHNNAQPFNDKVARLNYEYKEHEGQVIETEKEFAPIAARIQEFYDKAQAFTQNKATITDDDVYALQDTMQNYLPELERVRLDYQEAMYAESTRLNKEAVALDEEEEKLVEQYDAHEELAQHFYTNYDSYSLDLCAYDDDMENFKDVFSKAGSFDKESRRILDRYNTFLKLITRVYDQWRVTAELLNTFFDEQGMLDNSLSASYAAGTGDPAKKPMYLLPPDDKKVSEFKGSYGLLASPAYHSFTLDMQVAVIKSGDVAMLQEIIMAMQHFPKMIEKWIFGIDVQIRHFDSRPLGEEEWKGIPAAMNWYNKLNSLPCCIFFIRDRDARGYCIMGDLLAGNKLPVEDRGKPGSERIAISGDMLQEICDRVLEACRMFKLYCHNTGFDPELPIEALLAEFSLPVTYEDVIQQYEEDLKDGVQLKAIVKR